MPLVRGNGKLGDGIWHWALRSGPDCPGKTKACSSVCYAAKGHFQYASVQQAHMINKVLSDSPDFVGWINLQLKVEKVKVLRIHSDGDLYNSKYAEKWFRIAKANPHIKFFAYTRSWRSAPIKEWLDRMAKLPNFALWYSVDKDSGIPKKLPKGVKLAYLQLDENDIPATHVDLVFRVHKLRKKVVKKVRCGDGTLGMVCVTENGVTHTTCDKCKFCFRDTEIGAAPMLPIEKKLALPLVAA